MIYVTSRSGISLADEFLVMSCSDAVYVVNKDDLF